MTQPTPMQTPAPWNLVAEAYTVEVAPIFEQYARDAIAAANVASDARIVDVACGPGTLAMVAARAGMRVDAIDFSPAMIAQCNARLKQLGITTVTAREGDGQALPYDAGTFAAAFSMFGVMFFPDRAKGFAELRRVLVPGGRAVIATWTVLDDVPVLSAMFGAVREAMAKLLGPAAPPAAPDLPLTSEADCRAEMTAAGFRDVAVRRVTHAQPFASAAELWGSLQRTMAPIAMMKQRLGARWSAIDDAALPAIRAVLGDGAGELTMTALLTSGVA